MPRDRAVAIVLHNNALLVMFRKNTIEYYVFPGGGVEDYEGVESAVVREVNEETSIKVTIDKKLFTLKGPTGEMHFYYLCNYVSGKPSLRQGTNEHNDIINGLDYYEPMWLPLENIRRTTLYPNIAKSLLIDYINDKTIDSERIFVHD